MFTKLKLKNFKTFRDVEINLESRKGHSKPLVIIYGTNGSGKTTIAEAFLALTKSTSTMKMRKRLTNLLDDSSLLPENLRRNSDIVYDILRNRMSTDSIETFIKKFKTIGSKENMVCEYEFCINGHVGTYYLEMNDTSIVREKLEYVINTRRGVYFDIRKDDIYISKTIFKSDEYNKYIKDMIDMYWGKHTMLSIILFEKEDKTKKYIEDNIDEKLLNIAKSFSKINYKSTINKSENSVLLYNKKFILKNIQSGNIDYEDEHILDDLEISLSKFFTTLFPDIVKAFYVREKVDNSIKYNLYLRKVLNDHEYNIDFDLESDGTKEILKLLPYLISAASGNCVVIDEYGIYVHELLASTLVNSISNNIKGQLIITTHNTALLENQKNADSFYFITNNEKFEKKVRAASELEKRNHDNYNYRNHYLKNDRYGNSHLLDQQITLSDFCKL